MTAATITLREPARKPPENETLSMLCEHAPFGSSIGNLPLAKAVEVVDELARPPREDIREDLPSESASRKLLLNAGASIPPDPLALQEGSFLNRMILSAVSGESGGIRDLFGGDISKKDRNAVLDALKEMHFDGTLSGALLQAALNEMMKIDVAIKIERIRKRPGHAPEETWRNGYRKMTLKTVAGEIVLKVPKLRKGTYYPTFLKRWKRLEGKLVAVFQEAWIGGISTRGMNRIARILVPGGVSKSAVSRICKGVDERVKEFMKSKLEGDWSIIYLDATYVKSHVGDRVRDRAVAVAVGVDGNGGRHVLGIAVMPSESGEHWREFLGSLIGRGLRGVDLVVADGNRGLRAAVDELLPGADFQLCRVHWMRNVLAHVPSDCMERGGALLSWGFEGKTGEEISGRLEAVIGALSAMFPKVDFSAHAAEGIIDDLTTHTRYPANLWKRISATNLVERQNREIKRRAKAICIFPNEASIKRLIGARLIATDEEWRVEGEYMSETDLAGFALVVPGKAWASGKPGMSRWSDRGFGRPAA